MFWFLVPQSGGQDSKTVSFWEWQESAGFWREASVQLYGDLFLGMLEYPHDVTVFPWRSGLKECKEEAGVPLYSDCAHGYALGNVLALSLPGGNPIGCVTICLLEASQ